MAEERLEEIRKNRLAKRQALLEAGRVPYPAEAKRTHTVAQLQQLFDELTDKTTPVTIVGRIMALREHGAVSFLDIVDATGKFQVQLSKETLPEEIFTRIQSLDVGDFLQVAGTLVKTQRGVPTLLAAEFHILAKSIRPLPSTWYGLKDHEARFRQRELDLLLNQERRHVLEVRGHVIAWLRDYLHQQGYLEVETPVLQPIPGGAAARPFITHHNTLDVDLYLRISAELYLKRLLAAGFEKVFEIERRFRNEGISRQHNPEFTMIESQWAYADYEDLMDFTEDVLEELCRDVAGSTKITWQGIDLSFTKPFNRVRYVDLVSDRVGFDILEEKDIQAYRAFYAQEGLKLPEVENYYHLVDELYKELIRPTIVQPTLLYDYPIEMAPLAKAKASDPRVAEKFQLLAVGMELNNAYTELNDPVLQREAFAEQQKRQAAGDMEAQAMDEAYLVAMEYGIPPNAGWSLGIDRFVMLLTDTDSIRDTIAFPLLRPEQPLE